MTLLLSSAALSLLAVMAVWWTGRRDPARSPLLTTGCLLSLLALPLLGLLPKYVIEVPLATAPGGSGMASLSAASWLALAWLLGFAFFALRFGADLVALARWRRRSRALEDSVVLDLLETCRRQLGLRREIRIREHPDCGSPLIAGLLRPTIYLPAEHRRWSGETLRMVLLHELGHVSRRDLWRSLAARIACLVHWFNPLVWWLRGRLMTQCEFACDATVIEAGADPAGYATALCDVAEGGLPPRAALAMAGRASLRMRVEQLVCAGRPRTRGTLLVGAALILTVTASLALSVLRFGAPLRPAEEAATSPYTPEEIHLRLTANPFPGDES